MIEAKHRSGNSGHWHLLAVAVALASALAFAFPILGVVFAKGMSWPVGLSHAETQSLSTYGKWFFNFPGTYLTDAFSGEIPVFYNYASDYLLNLAARLTGLPPMSIQAVVYGPLLEFMLVLGGYFCLVAVLQDRAAALAASAIVAFGSNSQLGAWLDPQLNQPLDALIHVPVHALALGNGQSLGWVLFLPCVCALYLARRRGGIVHYLCAGISLGLLFHVHTLTFINVAAIHLAYVSADLGLSPEPRRGWRIWLGAQIVLIAAAAVWMGAGHAFGLPQMVLFGVIGMIANFLYDEDRKFYLWVYIPAGLVTLPYLIHLLGLGSLPAEHGGQTVAVSELLLFYSVYLFAALVVLRSAIDREVKVWLFSMLAATLLLGYNHLWGWHNHPYRYVINLIFPLAIAAAVAVRCGGRTTKLVLVSWLGAIVAWNSIQVALGHRIYVNYRVGSAQEASFLDSLESITKSASPGHAVMLNPPEFNYPQGSVQSAQLLNYSAIPGFIPDYRYQTDTVRYANRMALFCFLFNDYPHFDGHTGFRACAKPIAPPGGMFQILEPKLKDLILPLYTVRFAAAAGEPFGSILASKANAYGWNALASAEGGLVLMSTAVPALPGVAQVGAGTYDERGLGVELVMPDDGNYVIALGGRNLSRLISNPIIDTQPAMEKGMDGDWAYYEASVSAGRHKLLLPWSKPQDGKAKDYLYFIAVIEKSRAASYLHLD